MSSDSMPLTETITTRFRGRDRETPLALLVPLFGIAVSELALFAGVRAVALWGHLLTLFLCALAPLRFTDTARLFQPLALVPAFRLINLGMPIFVELTIYWFPLIYAPLLPGAYLLARSHPDIDVRLGWRTALLALPLALPASAAMGWLEFQIIEPEAFVTSLSLPNLLLITTVMVGFVGFVEELVFRGLIQDALSARLGSRAGLAIASGLFGLMHSGYGLVMEIAFATGIGVVYGYVYQRTDSLVLVAVMHGVLNVFLFAVVPLWPAG